MSEDLHTIREENLHHVIRLMNESSRGMSLETHLNLVGFLGLWRCWNFSCEHSLIRYVEGEPAALILNCTDVDAHDAYTFYWGALPKFRNRRISLALFDACCRKLHDNGYTMLYGDSVPDRPVRRYRLLQAQPQYDFIDMQAISPALPAAEPRFEVQQIDCSLVSRVPLPQAEPIHWCQRHAFLRNAAAVLQFLGAFAEDALKAYMVVLPSPANTVLFDLRSPGSCLSAGYELLRFLVQNYRAPFTATNVRRNSYAHSLLTSAGFGVKREFSSLYRDLRTTCSTTAT
ncbi:MAG TPA: hypothetical protein VMT53_15710 [Terriglobales bacterium]|jgi:hypothetical protein|nr:hypothetical protein [Terriglobales bacterium]